MPARLAPRLARCAVALVAVAPLAACTSTTASVTERSAAVAPATVTLPAGTTTTPGVPTVTTTTATVTTTTATVTTTTATVSTVTTIRTTPVTRAATTSTAAITTSTATTTTTAPATVSYVYPFVGRHTSYGTTHHDYPAADVFGCGATVVAPIDATVLQTRDVDRWDPATNNPADRGGKYVAILGADGVRYYFAHLDHTLVAAGTEVHAGDPLGVMGQTGDARLSACHTHVGISWTCDGDEWEVRRGEIWPQAYLDSWRTGGQRSPVDAVATAKAKAPDACAHALSAAHAAEA